jgi:hypothetical protein
VHGCIFTRGGEQLRQTAIFIGGTRIPEAEVLLQQVKSAFFGPLRVAVMFDANGCNTTAAATVIAAGRHVKLNDCQALVLAATGPVGQRVARLLAKEGAVVKVADHHELR